jgi:uncharacterized protein YdeI (YjbR/CyaY-like superfamily)
MNPSVDFYFDKAGRWQQEVVLLRKIVSGCGLTEELKWGAPCYTYEGSNIVLIHTFKDYCALLFMKGALMKDPKGILIRQTANVQAARQIRFTGAKDIRQLQASLKSYVKEAITIEKAGLKVELKKTKDFDMPDEFANRLKADAGLKKAFYALTPGRQRGYLLYFSGARQAKTRETRIDKYTRHILAGKGLDD